MTVYHVETQGDYDVLMIELEEKGCEWRCGVKPTQLNKFKIYGKDTYIYEEYDIISLSDGYYSKVYRSNETLIEYKAKGDNMTQEEMKHKLQEVAKLYEVASDVSVAIETFARGALTVKSDLQEAKSSAKSLIEKIDEYFETLKPKFKVGDYATFDIPSNKKIAKIDRVNGDKLHGLWYDTKSKDIEPDYYGSGSGTAVRYATPKEIEEYKAALTFHKHGRKPFEVKEGDIISYSESEKIFVDVPSFWDKEDFTSGDYTLVKTAEEYNEWIENK